MSRRARFFLVLALLALLPLRGYAALAASLCDAHHGGAPAAHATAHDHATDQDSAPHEYDSHGGLLASVCGLCSASCVSAPVASEVARWFPGAAAGASRIPFVDSPASGVVPGHLDRPPLALSR